MRIPRFRPAFGLADLYGSFSPPCESVSAFCQAFSAFIGVKHAIAAPSARGALLAILQCMGLRKGGEIIVPGLTFFSVPAVIQKAGFRVRFVDTRQDTYCIDTEKLEAAIGPSTVAIVPVHLYGRACDMKKISEAARCKGLAVIEDCAQACGAFHAGKRVGAWGDAAIFSFHLSKNLPALNFGMITTDSDELAQSVANYFERLPKAKPIELAQRVLFASAMVIATRPAIWHFLHTVVRLAYVFDFDPIEALTSEQPSAEPGDLGRMPCDYQARVALRLLSRVDKENESRWERGEKLRELLGKIDGLGVPAPSRKGENIYLSFVVRVKNRWDFRKHLMGLGFDTHPGNMVAGPLIPGLEASGDCPIAQATMSEIVHLPIHTGVDVEVLAEAVRQAFSRANQGRSNSKP